LFLRYFRYPLSSVSSFVFGSHSFSIPLILLRYSRYRPSSPVSSPCRYQSCPPSLPHPHSAFRLFIPSSLGYPLLCTGFRLSPVIILPVSFLLRLLFPLYF
jgi:hypothetical protein